MMIELKTPKQIGLMREAGRIVAEVLELMKEVVKPGVTTLELDRIAEDYIRKQRAIPTFKGYGGFPASICASVNEEIVHGIPSERVLLEGDIISIDCGATLHGYVGDAARTYAVGKISDGKARLIKITEESFWAGMQFAKAGYKLGDISHAIQAHAEKNGYSVVRDLVGHGIGRNMHEEPNVPNYGHKGKGMLLKEGLTIAVEPMINMGHHSMKTLSDGWTCITRDKLPSAHYENTIAITKGEVLILTRI